VFESGVNVNVKVCQVSVAVKGFLFLPPRQTQALAVV